MKRFLCTTVFAAAVATLLILGTDRSLPLETNVIASAGEPIKVLGVKLSTAGSESNNKSKRQLNGIEGLEVEIENTSGKRIQYLVIHAEILISPSAGAPIRIPLAYGKAPVPGARSGKGEPLQPGAKINLKVPETTLDTARAQIIAKGRIPSTTDIQTKINIVVFEDKTAWAGGQLNYPDPANPGRWIAGEELTRNRSLDNHAFGMKYSKASYKATTNDCYRFTGTNLQYCCSYCCNGGEWVDLYVANFNFTGDPTGHVQPNTVEACCPQGAGCCFYDESTGCS